MNNTNLKILVITPINHINKVSETLKSIGEVTCLENPELDDVLNIISDFDALYTNPNKSNVFIGQEIMGKGVNLKVICTASTGTNHIDKDFASSKKIAIISLTEERELINKISSTAELAFALMISALRHITESFDSVKNGEWNYEPYIGRQLDHLTIGVVGFGRLGGYFAHYCHAFGSRILIYDPYKEVKDNRYEQVDLETILKKSDIISLHVHANAETTGMVDESWFSQLKSNVIVVNSARGDVCDEVQLINFLKKNPNAKYATDVIANEIVNKEDSIIIEYAKTNNQILVTPHIGGMTQEGQMMAYNHAATMLKYFFQN